MGKLPDPQTLPFLFDLACGLNDDSDHLYGDLGCLPPVFRNLKGFHILIKAPVPIAQYAEGDMQKTGNLT